MTIQIIKGENMSEFNFNSQICTSRSQSEHLLALGVKPETADMSSDGWNDPVVSWGMEWSKEIIESGRLPAWSLHRLMILAEMKGSAFLDLDAAYETTISVIAAKIRFGYFNKDYLEE